MDVPVTYNLSKRDDGNKKGNFHLKNENSRIVAETGKLTNQIVEDFLKFCEIPDCQNCSDLDE